MSAAALSSVGRPGSRRGTQVTVSHRGFGTLRPDHPARHGLAAEAFVRMMGLWWGELATALREHAERGEGEYARRVRRCSP